MRRRRLLLVILASSLGACAGSKGAKPDGLFSLKFDEGAPAVSAVVAPTSDPSQVDAFTIEASFESADGRRLAAPHVTVYSGQAGRLSLSTPSPDGSRAEATAGRVDDGISFEVCPRRAGDGGVSLGFRVRVAKRGQADGDASSAAREAVEFEGARWLEPGVQGLLGRVAGPDDSGPILVLARVTPTRVDAPAPGALPAVGEDAGLSREMSGLTRHLRVTAVHVPRDFEPGLVIDETATPDVMKSLVGRVLRDYEVWTCVDSRVRIAGTLESGERTAAFVAAGREDGRLELSWTTTGGARNATVRPNAGRRFVALARVEGGGTAGVLVAVDVD
jgi:hypothetical protein